MRCGVMRCGDVARNAVEILKDDMRWQFGWRGTSDDFVQIPASSHEPRAHGQFYAKHFP